ncbi:DUF475 domain-containing protein [Undibacterium parvum]|uniref:DUF475 domain-containing protein n=1 Tax=Undibacterium parvum TaxID=401471 RepID=A0A3Q9BQR7_9BURK|nr:DUF475 domain-containing protein [Undibacterium parvum]AZP12245.1 DUF475 domain-containing protein [Undibacterium parvum]
MLHFRFSILISLICLALAAYWGYTHGGMAAAASALGLTLILAVLEISLSFDNAVVNVSVLKNWDAYWQNLFLTLGIVLAVFGMRLLFPLVVVAQAADLGLLEVGRLALHNPKEFSTHLIAHHAEVAAFGGVFLLLVFLNFLLDEKKELHWLGHVEEKLALFGRIGSVPVLLALAVVLSSISLVGAKQQLAVLLAGVWGIITYVGVDFVSNLLEKEELTGVDLGGVVKRGGIGGFLYLEVLDASFSFDGVIGAFAITSDVVLIMLGLAIGAMFVRAMTVYLVRQGTLEKYVYLEHGAHYAIGILALIMFASIKYHIPELFTGLVGVSFIFASLWSSIKHQRSEKQL